MVRRVLVVEDEKEMRHFYERFLKRHRDELTGVVVENADQALGALSTETFEIMVVDWAMPDVTGLELVKAIRSIGKLSPLGIVMVTALKSSADTVAALRAGVDDYITKPFDEKVLLARLIGLGRRSESATELRGTFRLDGLEFRPATSELIVAGKRQVLRPKEADLLKILLLRPNMIHRQVYLWETLWGYENDDWVHILTATISSLRRKLGPVWGPKLESFRTKGYLFNKPQ